jgi:Folylpolyglutamate synthase
MKSYSESLKYLYGKLPNYQKYGNKDLNFGLSNIISFSRKLNNPQNKFKTIHIAGTNGKGSVAHIIAAILQSKGLSVGIYSSPHLIDFRERIKVNGKYISKYYIKKVFK